MYPHTDPRAAVATWFFHLVCKSFQPHRTRKPLNQLLEYFHITWLAFARAFRRFCVICICGSFGFISSPAISQDDVPENTVDKILDSNKITCGVSDGVAGFSRQDERGNWVGFDVDYCRALAAAMLGDDSRVEFVPLSSSDRFPALASGQVDVLFRNTTWTLTRDIELFIDFAAISFYDGQGFIVKKSSGITSVEELDGKTVCVLIDTTTDKNLTDYSFEKKLNIERQYNRDHAALNQDYLTDKCDALTTDSSGLAGIRSKFDRPQDHVILPERISKEPLALAVRQGDNELRDLVAWTHYALVAAEEMGINQSNVEEIAATSRNVSHRRLLGVIESAEEQEADLGLKLNLDPDWAFNVIRQVGSYADIFEFNLGTGTAIGLDRGLNALHSNGGLMYSPPLR